MSTTDQFTVYATFLAKAGQYEQMKEVSQQSFDLTKETPGLVQTLVLEPPKAEKPFVIVSIWESKAAFRAFMKMPKMQEFHSAPAIKKLFDTVMETSTADFYTLMDQWHTVH